MVIRPYQPTADTLNPKEALANISIEKCHMVQINAADQITFPPRDLWSEEPPLESYRHLKQLILLLWRTPDYFWFDTYSLEFKGFKLIYGKYEEIEPGDRGWLWSDELQLYLGIVDEKLRFFTPDGRLVLTPEEEADLALSQIENERKRSDIMRQKLQEMGIDPDELVDG